MPTPSEALILYAELTPAQVRSAQRGLKSGQLQRIAPGVVTAAPTESWPALIARERLRILAALYPQCSHRSQHCF
jgi:hypothetical protein